MLTKCAEELIGKQVKLVGTVDQVIMHGHTYRLRVVLPGGHIQEFAQSQVGYFIEGLQKPLNFDQLRLANVQRCEEVFHPLHDWSPTDWATALAGEAGETCNEVKKLRRLDGADASIDTPEERERLRVAIGKEIADLIIYADLLAARLNIDLSDAVAGKFNEVSIKRGSAVRLPHDNVRDE